jgi:hypothetical protein
MVDLVLLHGPPASGKLTIAKELSALSGARVFHNHLTLDVAKSMFDFGEAEFWDLVHDLRMLSFQSYFKNGSDPLVTTWCYEQPEDYELFLQIKSIAANNNGRVLPVFLNCDIVNLEDRVTNDHRHEMDKLCNVKQLREIIFKNNYIAIPDELCIEINSATNTAEFNAREIARIFNL